MRFPEFEEEWKYHLLNDFLSESKILGSDGKQAKKLSVKLWAKGVVEKNTVFEGSENTQYYIRKAGQLMYGKLDFLNCAFGIVPPELDGYESTLDAPAFDINNINPDFLLNRIIQRSFYKKNGDIANGSRKAKRIHPDTFLSMEIATPSLQEQNKIAKFLAVLEQRINKQNCLLTALKSYKRGALQYIFASIKRKLPLHQISEYYSSANTMSMIECIPSGVYPVYDASGVVAKINKFDFNEAYVAIIKDGSGVGRLQLCESHSSIIGTLGALFPKHCSVGYLYAVLQTIDYRQFVTGMAIPHIYYKDYKNIEVPFPDDISRNSIERLLSNIDTILDKECKLLNLLQLQKASLLQQLFI